LIKDGLHRLAESGVGLVFVLGHPKYYPRHGFEPALPKGFEPPYPISAKLADAWMVQLLRKDAMGKTPRTLRCCDALNKPELWGEPDS
jgi:putative acetyltransferase